MTKIIAVLYGLIEIWRELLMLLRKAREKAVIEEVVKAKEEVIKRDEAIKEIKESESDDELWDAQEKLVRAHGSVRDPGVRSDDT